MTPEDLERAKVAFTLAQKDLEIAIQYIDDDEQHQNCGTTGVSAQRTPAVAPASRPPDSVHNSAGLPDLNLALAPLSIG